MATATSRTRQLYPLSPNKVIKKTLNGAIGWFIVMIFFNVAVSIVFTATGNWQATMTLTGMFSFLLFCIIVFLNYLYQKWYFDFYFYDLTPDYIVIRKGPITPREITIPYERIQDVYVDQDIFDRMFGLYDVHLSSATISSGMEAHIDGVEKPAADGLRAVLLQTVSARISKSRGQSVAQGVPAQSSPV